MRVLDIANEYRDMPETHFAHPAFAVPFKLHSYKLYDFYGHFRGDANNDGLVNVGDAVYLVAHIFRSGPASLPDLLTGDANCSGGIDAGGPAPQICFEY